MYELTKQIHELLPQVKANAKSLGFWDELNFDNIESDCDYFISYNLPVKIVHYSNWCEGYIKAIQAPQIRQILHTIDVFIEYKVDSSAWPYYQRSASEFCRKWVDGLTPLFDTNPEQVLTELRDILKDLLK